MIGISELSNGIRKLGEIQKKLSDVAFQEQILELRSLLVETQESLLEKDNEIRELKDQLARRDDARAFAATLVDVNGWKYRKNGAGEPIGLPYCPACEANYGLYFQIFRPTPQIKDSRCPNCKEVFGFAAELLRATPASEE
jgi:hypothetical protein